MIRVYDTNALWRHDEILRIRHLEAEIDDKQKEIDRQKLVAVAAEERFQRTKKWLGITDPAEPFISLNINTTDHYLPVPTLRSSISWFSV